jgi:large subunit ribosomal protein L25
VLSVAAKPGAIPAKIEVDVTSLEIGTAVHVSDLKLAEGIRALIDAREAVASVVAPKAEKVEAAAVEGAAEAAAPAAAGDKAAAAGGDKAAPGAAAKPGAAAAAPKKDEKKK